MTAFSQALSKKIEKYVQRFWLGRSLGHEPDVEDDAKQRFYICVRYVCACAFL